MATDGSSAEQVRRQIDAEREQLADAVSTLRTELHEATNVAAKLPVLAAGALAAGFVLAGGLGATARLLFRRGREGRTRAAAGRFKIVERD